MNYNPPWSEESTLLKPPCMKIIPLKDKPEKLLLVECGRSRSGRGDMTDNTIWAGLGYKADKRAIFYETADAEGCSYDDIGELLTFWKYVEEENMLDEMEKYLEEWAKDDGFVRQERVFTNGESEDHYIHKDDMHVIEGEKPDKGTEVGQLQMIDESDSEIQKLFKKHYNDLIQLDDKQVLLEFMKNDAHNDMSDQVIAAVCHKVFPQKLGAKACPSFETLLTLKKEIGTLFGGEHEDVRDTEEWKDWVRKSVLHRLLIQAVCSAPKGSLNKESVLMRLLDSDLQVKLNHLAMLYTDATQD